MMMSSRYAMAYSPLILSSTYVINSWNTLGALHRPNGITLNSYKPLWQAKAVLLRSLGSNSTCQYPDLRSKQVKCFFFPIDANISSICGSGQTYDFVILFNFRKSTQNCFDPSDFSIRTTGNDHSEWLGLIMLFFNISFTASSMTRLWFMAVRYGRNLMGGLSPVSIFILTALVLPKSLSVSANKSLFRLIKCCNWFWYSGGAVICPTSNTASSPPPATVDSESADSRNSVPRGYV